MGKSRLEVQVTLGEVLLGSVTWHQGWEEKGRNYFFPMFNTF